jgi:hypothetical protein
MLLEVQSDDHITSVCCSPCVGAGTFEQGCARVVDAHLNSLTPLPERYTEAAKFCAKLTDIGDKRQPADEIRVNSMKPEELLNDVNDQIQRATFVGKADRTFVQFQIAGFEWTIGQVMSAAHTTKVHPRLGARWRRLPMDKKLGRLVPLRWRLYIDKATGVRLSSGTVADISTSTHGSRSPISTHI